MDHFVILDPAMTLALLRHQKTQMRVLEGSPLAGCAPGDVILARESWMAGRTQEGQDYITAPSRAQFAILTDGWRQYREGYGAPGHLPRVEERRWLPPMQMPRWAVRMSLKVEWTRHEKLRQLSRADIRAEGLQPVAGGLLWRWPRPIPGLHATARGAFARYWTATHPSPEERWEDNPRVVVLGVRVIEAKD